MKKLKIITTYMFLCTLAGAQSSLQQQAEKSEFVEMYKKMWSVLSLTESYTFKINYISYEDHKTKDPYETSSGFYLKSGDNYKSNVMGIKTIQNQRIKVMIDTIDNVITLANPDKINIAGFRTEELEELVEDAADIHKTTINKSLIFKIDFEENELYDSYEIRFSENGVPEKMIFYYSAINDKDYEDDIQGKEITVKPRLEISFDDFKTLSKVKESDFSENLYVFVDNKNIKKTDRYKNYSVLDYRIIK